MAALGLRFYVGRLFSSCGEWGLAAVRQLLITAASLVSEHRLKRVQTSAAAACGLSSCSSLALEHRLSSCGTQAQLCCGTWDLPRPGIELCLVH